MGSRKKSICAITSEEFKKRQAGQEVSVPFMPSVWQKFITTGTASKRKMEIKAGIFLSRLIMLPLQPGKCGSYGSQTRPVIYLNILFGK